MANDLSLHGSSYRDPSGYIFLKEGIFFRQINLSFKENFDHFISSGCYSHLVKKGLLLEHSDESINLAADPDYYKIIRPEQLAYISYPYEWCFDMLKDAALLTLQLVKECLSFGIILKDATPYNIQWHRGRLIFIDTLSFEKYDSSKPWIAYHQFCESFLAPLLLMHYNKVPLHELMLAYPNGIPLHIAHVLLPWKSRLSFHTYLHIHLHSKIAMKANGKEKKKIIFSQKKLLNLISSLEMLVNSLKLKETKSTWLAYYDEAEQRKGYLHQKQKIIQQWLTEINSIKTGVDLGANEGEFSNLMADKGIDVIAVDFDSLVINRLYKKIKISKQKHILPLIADLSNPSPAIGVNNKERQSFIERAKVDITLALALIHHLTIGKNIPFSLMVEMFSEITDYLIIEFIPKEDEKIRLMLMYKTDIYKKYNEQEFSKEFEARFSILAKEKIADSGRTLFLMKKK
ncbi:MAG TPA: hypothetical protein VKC90_02465 [Chitinophagaceae bacterium]|nr:hypothetical protein [Chitinophagaceae bacterium]